MRAHSALIAFLIFAMPGWAVAEGPGDQPSPATRDGYFVARLVTNAQSVGIYYADFNSLSVSGPGSNGKERRFDAINQPPYFLNPGRPSVIFGGWLPPGEYRVQKLQATAGTTEMSVNLKGILPTFQVNAGEVVDLGTLVFQPVGGGEAVLFPAPAAIPVADLIARDFTADAGSLAGMPVSRWDGSAGWSDRRFPFGGTDTGQGLIMNLMIGAVENASKTPSQASWSDVRTPDQFLDLAKRVTVNLSHPAVRPDGTAYFGSALGQVLRRSATGKWSNLDTGQLAEVTAVHLTPAGELLAGLEDGRIYRLEQEPGAFSLIGQAPDRGRVVDVRLLADDHWVLVTRQMVGTAGETRVYFSPSPGQWPAAPDRVFRQPMKPGFTKGVSPFPEPALGRSRYYISIRRIVTAEYDIATRAWIETAVKKKAEHIAANNSGTVLYGLRPARVSTDDGRTWNRVNLAGYPPVHGIL
jgi:hypothetical protein